MLQGVEACCSVLQRVTTTKTRMSSIVSQAPPVSCSVLQCVAARGSVLQCAVTCFSVTGCCRVL